MATVTDDFNRALLGMGWTQVTGTWEIALNQLDCVLGTSNNAVRFETDLATADHYAQAVIAAQTRLAGVAVRFSPTAQTLYRGAQNGGTWAIAKVVAGGVTTLATFVETAPTMPYTIRLEVEGSALRLYKDGVLKVSTTDGAITGNLRAGICGFHNDDHRWDDFAAGDLGAPPPAAVPMRSLMGVGT